MHDPNNASIQVGQSARRPALAAAIWSFLFAGMSTYWALGGLFGIDTLGEGMQELALAGDPELFLVNNIGIIGKLLLGVLALALTRPWHNLTIRKLLRWAAYAAGSLLAFYGAANLLQHLLMFTGTIPVARLLGSTTAVLWHLLFWDPFWLLGGVLFLISARRYNQS
jgi:hypothetical protein